MVVQERTVLVESLRSKNGGGAIFRATDGEGRRLKVVAPYQAISVPPAPGETWSVSGEFRRHPKYGWQLHARQLWQVLPSGRFLFNYLSKSPALRGIGLSPKAAKALLVAHDEDRLVDHLNDGNAAELSKVLDPAVAEALVERWRLFAAETQVVRWLTKFHLDHRVAGMIMRIWGEQAIYRLQEDPYRMLIFMGWARVDKAARQMGVGNRDERRLVGAVEAALYARLDRSHTLTSHEKLRNAVRRNLGLDTQAAHLAIETAAATQVIVGHEEFGYQLRGIARLERKLKERLEAMLEGESGAQGSLLSLSVTDDLIGSEIGRLEARLGYPLNRKQRQAVEMAARQPVSVICGAAGTGKTTVLLGLHQILEQAGLPVFQMALSGRAAQRMREATEGRPAHTIAGFCLRVRTGKLEVPDDALVIVDEASMLDLPTMYRILACLPCGARLLLVGDPYQLPPIGFGLVFDVLVASDKVPKVELTEVHRQAAASGIPAAAAAIRLQNPPAFLPYSPALRSGVSFIEAPPEAIAETSWEVFSRFVAEGMDPAEIRVLSPIKTRPSGVNHHNQLFQHRLADRLFYGGGTWKFGVDDLIIHLKNDHEQELYNGSLGVIREIAQVKGGWVIRAEWDNGEFRDIDEAAFQSISLAFAMTIHKAQGSQFRRVILPIEKSRVLDNSMVYTALTRGVEQVVFIGDRVAFERAVKAPPRSHRRDVGFTI